jgi:hypothetical protein
MPDNELSKFRSMIIEAEESPIVPVKETTKFKDHYGTPIQYGHRIALAMPSLNGEAIAIVGVLQGIYHDRMKMYFKLDDSKFMIKSGFWIYQWETKEAHKYDKELHNVAVID